MRLIVLGLFLTASPVLAQVQTQCSTMGNATNCTSTGGDTVPTALDKTIDRMLFPQHQAPAAAPMPIPPQVETSTPHERRAIAYQQVGALIAKGDCAAASRLAAFYGQPDIKRDTAKACPVD